MGFNGMKRILFLTCIGISALALSAWGEQFNTNTPGRAKAKANVSAAQSAQVGRAHAVRSTGQVRTQASVTNPGFRQRNNVTVHNNSNMAVTRNNLRSTRVHTHDATVQNTNRIQARNNIAVNRGVNRNREFNRTRQVNVNPGSNVAVNRQRNFARNRNVNINRQRNVTVVNNWRGERFRGQNYAAFRNYHREWHDRDWWNHHYTRVVFISGGWWAWNAGYWYPAWGYDPYYTYYPYDGPIYTGVAVLSPDQVVVNVQQQLQREGYYAGPIDGVLGPMTREAIANYQADHGLAVTSAVDEPTLATMGLV